MYLFLAIVFLGFFLRFFHLGQNPPGLNWDEASIGYNAYSILKTGKDEYGNFLPLEFRSFDDYKPPLYIYLTVPSIAIFGLTEFGVRFPAALFGTLSIVVFFFLVKEVMDDSKKGVVIAIIGSLLLALSPWHLQFSRAAYEGNIGLFFIMLGALSFFKGMKKPHFLIFSSLSFLLSIYSYHSFRLIVPLFILALLILFFRKLIQHKRYLIISCILFIGLSLPIYIGFVNPQGSQSRLSMVSIFSESDGLKEQLGQLQIDREGKNYIGQVFHNRRMYFLNEGIKNYLDHFSPNYLFVIGAGSFHHHAKDMGMMYLIELPFLLMGLFYFFKNTNRKLSSLVILLLLAPLPAAVTTGTPHGVRSIAMIPGLLLIVAFGFYHLKTNLSKWKSAFRKPLLIAIVILFFINVVYYLNQYYSVTPRVYGYFWQEANKEAIFKAKAIEGNYEKVVMTYKYDQPYIYYLFYNRIDPSWYQKIWDYNGTGQVDRFYRKIGKYEFTNITPDNIGMSEKSLFIGTDDELSDKNPLDLIRFSDGSIAYKFVEK